ncbi:MAG: hypothetical protein WC761_02300 [Candidatus Paceibacterota bacterium]|jgi:hypothetical protein
MRNIREEHERAVRDMMNQNSGFSGLNPLFDRAVIIPEKEAGKSLISLMLGGIGMAGAAWVIFSILGALFSLGMLGAAVALVVWILQAMGVI